MSTVRPGRASTAGTKSRSQTAAPSYEEIAYRAYQLYLQRGAGDGRDTDDWLRAEQELTHEQAEAGAQRPKLSKSEAA